ncbi:MAG: phospholipase [Acetobacteraceae bacterium]|nr:phospholipase [Acetobacteraceae bacterium]
MHPPRLPELAASLGPDDGALIAALGKVREAAWPETMAPYRDQLIEAGDRILRAHDGLREAGRSPGGVRGAYQATRHQYRAIEALYPLAPALASISRFFIEPARRDDKALLARIAAARWGEPDTGVYHFANETNSRGGFSVYVPEYLTGETPAPVVFALHGGSGHGRVFLWSWLREARSRGFILVTPTATGDTWSLMEPEVDSAHLSHVLAYVREHWAVDPSKMLLSGMSDGGTFTLLSGLDSESPFTHLAPVAASFHPLLVTMTEPRRIQGLPVYLVHGALDWMFPITTGRTANQTLTMAGAKVTFREIEDLSHTYPRDENGAILNWLMG